MKFYSTDDFGVNIKGRAESPYTLLFAFETGFDLGSSSLLATMTLGLFDCTVLKTSSSESYSEYSLTSASDRWSFED